MKNCFQTIRPEDARKTKPRSAGFTLVELVIVLTIIGLLAGSSVYLIVGFLDDAKVTVVNGDLKNLEMAISAYEGNNYFRPPTQGQGLKALVDKPTSEPLPKTWRSYMEEMPLDPWGREYEYRIPAQRNTSAGAKYDLFSLGEDGVESEDDIGNWK